jgi:RNA polymerase sigma-70 factor (ECF subfamily)
MVPPGTAVLPQRLVTKGTWVTMGAVLLIDRPGGKGFQVIDAPAPGGGANDAALPAQRPVPVPDDWTPPTWDEVVREHSGRVFRLAYRLTGNVHDAEDLTQDVFVRVFRSLSSYTPGTFEGWLHRITTNLFLDGVRRKQRIRFDALADDAADRVSGRESPPDRVVDDQMLDGDIQAALDELPPDFRAAVVLCDIEGLSYEEIAATLDVKLGTVRSRIHRGRAQLRAALEHRAPRIGAADTTAAPDSGAGGPTEPAAREEAP